MKKEAPEQTTVLGEKPLSVILDEIEERANKAMAGPWSRDPNGDIGDWLVGTPVWPIADCDFAELNGAQITGNSAFIASARTDVPVLVKALRRQQAFIELTVGKLSPRSVRILNKEIAAILDEK